MTSGFPTTCDTCHQFSAPAWKPASFNHSTNTTFPLAGVHATQACTACHKNNVYKGTARDCYTCHLADYQKSVNPPHLAGGFATTCDTCHQFSAPAWKPAIFNHSTNTTFPLAGVHLTQTCATCHTTTPYRNAQTTCSGCHLNNYPKNYNNSANPPHLAGGFATTCDTCHQFSAPAWSPSIFNHSTMTPFALVGVHATQTCARCHTTMPYRTAPTTCVGCHQLDYNNSKNPSHTAAGFPTSCDTCHKATDATWQQGKFNHTYFPLTSNHNVPCNQCHTTINVFTVFNCIGCHTKATTERQAQGPHRLLLDVDGVLLVPPERKSWLMLRRFAMLAALAAWGAPAVAQSALDWGRISVFGQVIRTKNTDGTTSDYNELSGVRHDPHAAAGPGRHGVLPRRPRLRVPVRHEPRSALTVYDAWVGGRIANGKVAVRLGQMYVNDLGALGGVGGLSSRRGPARSASASSAASSRRATTRATFRTSRRAAPTSRTTASAAGATSSAS